jgi:hypothetical protein
LTWRECLPYPEAGANNEGEEAGVNSESDVVQLDDEDLRVIGATGKKGTDRPITKVDRPIVK